MTTKLIINYDDPIQQKSKDKFSFPFNGGYLTSDKEADVEQWYEEIKKYKYFLHDIYFALPDIPNFFSRHQDNTYTDNCIKLLEIISHDKVKIRRVAVLNGDYRMLTTPDKNELVEKAIQYIDKYCITGLVVTDFYIAIELHRRRPSLVLNTSCNVNHWFTPSLDLWRKHAGIELINPNRPMSRNIPKLKELKNAGFKIKLLINEHCTHICPQYLCSASCHNKEFCSQIYTNPLQSAVVIPRWLNILDEYVDIYKLTGRMVTLDKTLEQLKCYILRTDDCSYDMFYPRVDISCGKIPDSILFCNNDCAHCNTCEKVLQDNGIGSSNSTYFDLRLRN